MTFEAPPVKEGLAIRALTARDKAQAVERADRPAARLRESGLDDA